MTIEELKARIQKAGWKHAPGSLDVVYVNDVLDWLEDWAREELQGGIEGGWEIHNHGLALGKQFEREALEPLIQQWRGEAKDVNRALPARATSERYADELEAVLESRTGSPEKEPPGWVQIQAGSELAELVRLVRFTPGQAPGFFHSDFDAQQLLWRWFLKWRAAGGSPAPDPHEGGKR